jgi:hypothetical protein
MSQGEPPEARDINRETMGLRSLLVVLSLGAQLVASSRAAAAPPAAEDPEALIRVGNAARRKGDDKRAEGYLKRAYELARTPRSAAQLGLVELALGHFRSAEEHLSEALAADDDWVHDNREVLTSSRVSARSHLWALEIGGAPRDATVLRPEGAITKLPTDGVLWFDPGTVTLTVQAVGRKPAPVEASGAAGERHKVQVELQEENTPAPPVAVVPAPRTEPAPTAPSAPSGPADPLRTRRIAGIVVGAVGVAAVVTGVILLEKGNSEVDATNAGGTYNPANGNYQTLQNAGVGFMIGGAAAVAAGGALFVLGLSHGEAPAVSLNVGSGGGLVRVGGTF